MTSNHKVNMPVQQITKGETRYPLYIIDAFTSGKNDAYTGNPAAIVFLDYDDEIPDDVKQKVAASMKISQTVFMARDWTRPASAADGSNERTSSSANDVDNNGKKKIKRTIRWFCPNHEFILCGHGTFAGAKALLNQFQIQRQIKGNNAADEDDLPIEEILFETKYSGDLVASFKKEGDSEIITIDLPQNVPKAVEKTSLLFEQFSKALFPGSDSKSKDVFEEICYAPTIPNYVLLVLKTNSTDDPEQLLRGFTPDFSELKKLATTAEHAPGVVIVTIQGREDGEEDFYARTFAPFYNTDEDPVCGSAHTLLVPYWVKELNKDGDVLATRHVSSRGGRLECLWKEGRIYLSGTARIVVVGEISP